VDAPPPPARSLRPDLSPALEAVLARALAKRPEDRYPTGAALAAALADAAGLAGAVTNGPAPLATLLAADTASAIPGGGRRATLPSRPAGWDEALHRGRRAPQLAPADVLLLVLLAVFVLGALLWRWSTTSTELSAAGFVPVTGADATLPRPPGAASPTAAAPTGQAARDAGLPAPTLGPATPWWQTPTATRRLPVFIPPPATATPEPVIEGGPGGDPPAEPTAVPPTQPPPPAPSEPPPTLPTETALPPPTNTSAPPPTNTSQPPPTNTAPPPAPTATPEPDGPLDVTLCHRPPGNPDNAETRVVGPDELAGHLAHGDTLGPCP
jgi:serine/threonine-protein kinase